MIDIFVIEHYAWKKGITLSESFSLHEELELFLEKASTNNGVVPSILVDDVWHNFILHTKRYSDYCNTHFGFFIHHNPRIRKAVLVSNCDSETIVKKPPTEDKCDAAFIEDKASCSNGDPGGGGSDCGSGDCDSQFK